MCGLNGWLRVVVVAGVVGTASMGLAQGTASAPQKPAGQPPPAAAPKQPPLQLNSLESVGVPDPFPPANPKNFTADSPSVATVESYLHAMMGYDATRIWRVEAIQKTAVPGVSKVTALIAQKVPNSKVLTWSVYILPDGKHLIAQDPSGMNSFGADPFADKRALLQARADGPYLGAAAKDLELVEFSDLQCPHCKEALATMDKLVADFPRARIVYQNFPLTEIHPFAFQAAAYGVCVAKQNAAAYVTYAQAVYATQAGLTADAAVATLNAAVTKAGLDPAAISTCAATEDTKAKVEASIKLGTDLGVDQTPTLAINGRLIPLTTTLPYDILKSVIVFQATQDGAAAAAGGAMVLK
jgi:protein-disulfide isomerase